MNEGAAAFNTAFCDRVRALREGKGWTQEQMALALGISAERYRKYEKRSVMALYLLPRFAAIVECDLTYLVTGREPPRRPPNAQMSVEPRRAKGGRR